MEFIDIWSYFTLVVTLLMYITGLSPCMNMYRSKSTQNVPYNVFLLGAISCLGMFHYGLMVDNVILVFLNGVGAFLQAVYVLLYLLVVRLKAKPLLYLLLACFYDVVLYWYIYTRLQDGAQRADVLGLWSSVLVTLVMSLPAVELISNFRLKNADGTPLIMLLGSLLCCSSWLVYGLMLKDPNIYSPNIPGIVITVVKLCVIYLYTDKTKID